jgi:pectate lyase
VSGGQATGGAGGQSGGSGGAGGSGGTSGSSATAGSSVGGNAGSGGSGGGESGDAGTGGDEPGDVRAFPGAEGFGAAITGGRGGRVIKVTTLAATGPGSLQAALDESGPRIIVFAVSGVITADVIEVTNGDATIAGQSAPGAGITIQGRFVGAYTEDVQNIVVRHLRVRPEYDGSAGEQFDAVQFSMNRFVILDHLSVSFGVDENVDLYSAQDITVQWSTIESSATDGHPEGEHNYGLINGPDGVRASIHKNLFAHNKNRNPAIANGPAEVLNNVAYNVRHGFIHHNPASGPFNLIGNYFKPGSDDELIPFYFDDENGSGASDLSYYIAGNWVEGSGSSCDEGALDNPWTQCDNDLVRDESFRADAEHDFSGAGTAYRPVSLLPVSEAYAAVVARAGAFPRDVVTLRSVDEMAAGTGTWGAREPSDLMEGLTPTDPPTDADDDGMADAWEVQQGLDPANGDDHTTAMPSGYTAIEEYLNELADDLVAP